MSNVYGVDMTLLIPPFTICGDTLEKTVLNLLWMKSLGLEFIFLWPLLALFLSNQMTRPLLTEHCKSGSRKISWIIAPLGYKQRLGRIASS